MRIPFRFILLSVLLNPRMAKAASDVSATAPPSSAIYTFPGIIFASMLISWGAEAAQFFMAQGAALAILAWLQTLPEYAVEFVIAKSAAQDEARTHFMIANLTGSLRLLTGLGWPLIYFTALFFARKNKRPFKGINLESEHAIEVICLAPAILYWFFIWWKRSLTVYDGIVLIAVYAFYLWSLRKIPPQQHEALEDADPIPRMIVKQSPLVSYSLIALCLVGGGVIIYLLAHPFLESMLALAVVLGVPQFVFIQWLAPFLSEFPEKISAFNWARKVKTAPMAVMNMVSSNFNQWTVLAATLPFVFSIYSGRQREIIFDDFQAHEILLTLSQSIVGMVLLFNLHFATREAIGIFVLWIIQLFIPDSRNIITGVNFTWAAVEIFRAARSPVGFRAIRLAPRVFRGKFD